MARDLMFQQEIKETVQRAYAAITGGAGETVARRHYSDHELTEVPPGAVQWALGVGDPVRLQLRGPASRRFCCNAERQESTVVWVRLVQPAVSMVASMARMSS
jgi:hypothetical protein